ncbi:arginase family protein, partial [Streptomyces sp. NPDC056437]
MRNIVIVDAPSNLGLRPPAPGAVPGCYKLAGALREQRIVQRLGAFEGGVVVPPRYDRGDWQEG